MEFPDLGVHCAEPTCSRLDFLPFTCDACSKVFCLDHKTYDQHNCQESYQKDVRVPICPLCSSPVPVGRGEDPNGKVDEHIRNDCKSEAAAKLYVNRCSYRGCKKKELVQVNCNTCQKKFCLKHRFETDHNCEGPPNSGRKTASSQKSAVSSLNSARASPQATTLSSIGAELNRNRLQRLQQEGPIRTRHAQRGQTDHTQAISEDEALAAAISASLQEPSASEGSRSPPHHPKQPLSQVEEDEALAKAIAASLQPTSSKTKPSQESKQSSETCIIS